MAEAATTPSLDNQLCARYGCRNTIVNTVTGQRLFGLFCSADCRSIAISKSQPRQIRRPPPIEIPQGTYYAPAHLMEGSPQ